MPNSEWQLPPCKASTSPRSLPACVWTRRCFGPCRVKPAHKGICPGREGTPQQLQLDRAQDSAEYLGGAPRKCCWWPTLTGPRERQLITSNTASATAGGSFFVTLRESNITRAGLMLRHLSRSLRQGLPRSGSAEARSFLARFAPALALAPSLKL